MLSNFMAFGNFRAEITTGGLNKLFFFVFFDDPYQVIDGVRIQQLFLNFSILLN
jgi:hypothetical protein